jgi:hypothetical protein
MRTFGEDLGRLFEVGFTAGLLAGIERRGLTHRAAAYHTDLARLTLTPMVEEIARREGLGSEVDRQILAQWATTFVLKGFLSGLNLLGEYLDTITARVPRAAAPTVAYFQTTFGDANSMGIAPKGRERQVAEWLAQLPGIDPADVIGRYSGRGEFLNADALLLLESPGQAHILAIDLSVFFVRAAGDLQDLGQVDLLRRLLAREIAYLQTKSVFSQLSLDVDVPPVALSEGLADYLTAFARGDKESVKLIQAASYAWSFLSFLRAADQLGDRVVTLNVIGYSDRGISTMTLGPEHHTIAETCATIYQQKPGDHDIAAAREKVLQTIRTGAIRSFSDPVAGRAFLDELLALGATDVAEPAPIIFSEQVPPFLNTASTLSEELCDALSLDGAPTLRDAHASLIWRTLDPAASAPYVFLTGSPGIGKTTAISNFLRAHLSEGFLFLYVSPRTQVNLDIIERFMEVDGTLTGGDAAIALTTNANLIASHGGGSTVQYLANHRQGDFKAQTVQFVDGRDAEERRARHRRSVGRVNEELLQPQAAPSQGVLASMCEALHVILAERIATAIIAAISIQSLKQTASGVDTLERHFRRIFKLAYNEREGAVIPSAMQALARRVRHIFFMVDEVTGDESGVAFLSRIGQLARSFGLLDPKHGFNTKIIVADASIVDPDVITRHLSTTEPDRDKIYFRAAPDVVTPLSMRSMRFNRADAMVINANAFPASGLTLTYKVFVDVLQVQVGAMITRRPNLANRIQETIVDDIITRLSQPGAEQIIVYMQDKRRLHSLVAALGQRWDEERWGEFIEQQAYLIIHADLSEERKRDVQAAKDQARVVFMTASASRGLSFPRTRHILVVVPSFAIEQNLMEIIQVIYRGRGGVLDGTDKALTFYLAEQAISSAGDADRRAAVQERMLHLINLLVILKTAIMTRIQGAGPIGRGRYMMIPVGGKAVSAAGESFSNRMMTLLREIQKELLQRPGDQALRTIASQLHGLMGRAAHVVDPTPQTGKDSPKSYLNLIAQFEEQFVRPLHRGFHELLSLGQLEQGYLHGSLLVVPLADRAHHERYQMRLWEQLRRVSVELEPIMGAIAANRRQYPESLRATMRQALDLLRELRPAQVERTQWLEQTSRRADAYYAVPLFALTSREAFEAFYASGEEEPEEGTFRDLLAAYVQLLYPANNLLPIGAHYQSFPFVLFHSFSLGALRRRMFEDRRVLTSHELNVLTLLLAR